MHAVDPDKRRYVDQEEAPRHYIDLDHFVPSGVTDLETLQDKIPIYWNDAVEQLGEDSLREFGILPWHLNFMLYQLTRAFSEGNVESILRLSAEIGHYASDGHVPLHTTENYNGQLTGQKGIHALWESRIPERHAERYILLTDKASYLEKPQEEIWNIILASHSHLSHVFGSEMEIRNSFHSDAMYRPETKGRTVKKSYSNEFIDAYAAKNNDLVQQRMKQACHFIASLWYTAWVNAGQPKLNELSTQEIEGETTVEEAAPDHER